MNNLKNDAQLWDAKLHARLHDPAEKALILLRDPSGHEGGTSRELHARLFPDGVASATKAAVKRADWWASAADRPQFPRSDSDRRYARWTQVHFDQHPVLIHPLSGAELDLRKLGGLADTEIGEIKDASLNHFGRILNATGTDTPEQRRHAALALWRFGPELPRSLDSAKLGELWRLLPADTRVPDHSIWDHLDLTAAFAGAFAADGQGECALLNVSLGPVQDFISTARTASDLWAGSHLLSCMAWQAMKVLAEELGPEAILFPRLRGTALVDLWLKEECGLPSELFEGLPWQKASTDANPLFSAALPNRFLAVVPAERAQALARKVETAVRAWVLGKARDAFASVLEIAESQAGDDCHGYQQIEAQLAGFPEVHWSITPYSSLIKLENAERQKVGNTDALAQCMAPFFPDDQSAPGFLGSRAWQLLNRDIDVEGTRFYQPNPGVLYPALHELADRSLAASKTQRHFNALEQTGYRCSLTGVSEWLTDNPEQLGLPPGKRQDTLWARVATKKSAWAKKGEHLGALATLKRLWPTLFVEEIATVLEDKPSRFVVSTHAMALAVPLRELSNQPLNLDDGLRAEIASCDRTALPRKLVNQYISKHPDRDLIARIPAWLDKQAQNGSEDPDSAQRKINKLFAVKPETYYAFILMDGDRMGQWLSGDQKTAISYLQSFHPQIRAGMGNRFGDNTALQEYLRSARALSPSRHLAISGALGDFSATIARAVVEEEHMGRVLYAGGDDLLAMLPVDELPSMMARLRGSYSGELLDGSDGEGMRFNNGYCQHKNRLYVTMGSKATASMGAIVAHHQAPLGSVLKALRAAEQRAKTEGGRNAFSIQIIKRGGGDVSLTMPWHNSDDTGQPGNLTVLRDLSAAMREKSVSRRAAYNVYAWLPDLPEPAQLGGESAYRSMIQALLHHQFQRQKLEKQGYPVHSARLAQLCQAQVAADDARLLENFLSTAEFLARESRSLT